MINGKRLLTENIFIQYDIVEANFNISPSNKQLNKKIKINKLNQSTIVTN